VLENKRPPANLLFKNPVHILATGLGSGLSPKAPGTVGSLLAVFVYIVALNGLPALVQGIIIGVTLLAGFYICGKTAKDWNAHDHKAIVWDEWVGQWMVLMVVPPTTISWVVGFLLFRLFDVFKPWPISWADRSLHGGVGIMLDDVLAALAAIASYWIIFLVLQAVVG